MATIKFIDVNLVEAKVTLMVGLDYVTVSAESYRAIRELISKAGGLIKNHPFVGYVKDFDSYDRYSRSFAKAAIGLINSQRA